MTWQGSERRRHPRVQGSFNLEIHGPESSHRVVIKDISISGVCCISDTEMPEMSLVQMELLLDPDSSSSTIRCQGAVVRCEPASKESYPKYEVAIFFTEINDEDRRRIADYVDRQLEAA